MKKNPEIDISPKLYFSLPVILVSFFILHSSFFILASSAQEELKISDEDDALIIIEEAPEEDDSPLINEVDSASNEAVAQDAVKTGAQSLSLDIKGMDIVDVLKMLATRSGMNIIVGRNVTGKVTMFLKNVGIWDAFEIILLANDLAYEEKGGIINVMVQRDYELQYGERQQDKKEAKIIVLKYAKAADLSRALTQMKSTIGKIIVDDASNTVVLIDTSDKIKEMEDFITKTDLVVQTRVFGLQYAQADKLSAKIQEVATKGIGSVKIDERTNKIAVTDFPQKLDEIAEIIREFDEKTPQVLIDAQIVEITPSDRFESGVDWDYWLAKNLRFAASLPNINAVNKLSIGTAVVAGAAPAADGQYKGIIDLLRTIGDTKILSSPRIMALNNQEAKILVGTKEAYITSSTSQTGDTAVTSQSVNFVDVGIKLYVTPTINRDGFVIMKIKPEVSSSEMRTITTDDKETEIPIVTTSETETTIMVKDGVTIIIGGLKKEKASKIVTKVPLLCDIPLLGKIFKNTSNSSEKAELVILLTPHIMSGDSAYTEFSEIRPTEGAVMRMEKGEIISEKISSSSEKAAEKKDSQNISAVAKPVVSSMEDDSLVVSAQPSHSAPDQITQHDKIKLELKTDLPELSLASSLEQISWAGVGMKPAAPAQAQLSKTVPPPSAKPSVKKEQKEAAAQAKNFDYYRLINEKIAQVSRMNFPQHKKGKAVLSFIVSSAGILLEEPKIIYVSDPSLSSLAIKTVRESAPFPPFPKTFKKEKERFKISLSYE